VAGVLALGGAAVVGVGALGTDWFTEKVFRAGAVAGLPSLAAQLPRSVLTPERGGIHPNELAGTIVMVLPVSLSLALSRRVPGWIRLGLAVLFVVEAGVLVLTQSRGGWSGTLVGLAALGVVVWVRLGRGQGRIALGAAAAVVPALIGLVVFGPTRLLETMDRVVGGPSSSVSRVVLWSRAWDMIQDFPFTGVGLNTFPFVLDAWYPTFMSAPGEVIVHAHNLYLQMAVDLGIPGLLAFAALLWATARAAWTAARAPEPWASLALGCGIGLLAFAVYGLTDAITLGAKPGLFFWLEVATIALIARLAPNCPTGVADRQ
jgi:putative inorganic carbon (HCO3(-)) transporter